MAARESANDLPERDHVTARQLAEEALEAYVKGDRDRGDRLAQAAKLLDRSAVEEVIAEIDEDSGSDRDAFTAEDGARNEG